MQIKLYKATWGMPDDQPLVDKLRQIQEAGYDGVEHPAPDVKPAEWKTMLSDHGLGYIAQMFPFTGEEFGEQYKEACEYEPVCVDCHSGRDRMTFDEGCRFFEEALKIEADVGGAPVGHETHRGRVLYAPWTTARYLERFPNLKLTVDYSHWCCVTESLLQHVDDYVSPSFERAIHIHGRVGHEEAPQVPHPAAPEYLRATEAHEKLWDRVKETREKAGAELLTFNPEFGPWGYMPALPFTKAPVADLWDVCQWMADRIRRRWSLS